MDTIGRAYGAGLAGGSFDPISFLKRPQVILRIISLLMAVIVFGCIASGGWFTASAGKEQCLFNGSSGTCSFGTVIGVFAFLACIILIAIDAYFDRISSVQLRKRVVIGDLVASGVFVFFYFIGFCVLTSKWSSREDTFGKIEDYSKSPPQAAIAFSFLSIFSWGGLAFFAWRRYQEGAANAFAPSYDQDFAAGGEYGYPAGGYAAGAGGYPGGSESYQEPPFSAANESAAMPQYQQPAY